MCKIVEYNLDLPSLSRLPYSEWREKLRFMGKVPSDLVDFFENDFLNDTKNCQEVSSSLRSAGAVGPSQIRIYLDFWRRHGFLGDAGHTRQMIGVKT